MGSPALTMLDECYATHSAVLPWAGGRLHGPDDAQVEPREVAVGRRAIASVGLLTTGSPRKASSARPRSWRPLWRRGTRPRTSAPDDRNATIPITGRSRRHDRIRVSRARRPGHRSSATRTRPRSPAPDDRNARQGLARGRPARTSATAMEHPRTRWSGDWICTARCPRTGASVGLGRCGSGRCAADEKPWIPDPLRRCALFTQLALSSAFVFLELLGHLRAVGGGFRRRPVEVVERGDDSAGARRSRSRAAH